MLRTLVSNSYFGVDFIEGFVVVGFSASSGHCAVNFLGLRVVWF
jgi:hypothetical protein